LHAQNSEQEELRPNAEGKSTLICNVQNITRQFRVDLIPIQTQARQLLHAKNKTSRELELNEEHKVTLSDSRKNTDLQIARAKIRDQM
jgi:hypothetical protein